MFAQTLGRAARIQLNPSCSLSLELLLPSSPMDRLRLQEGTSRPAATSLRGPTVRTDTQTGTLQEQGRRLTGSIPAPRHRRLARAAAGRAGTRRDPQGRCSAGRCSACRPRLPISKPLSKHGASSTESPRARGPLRGLPLRGKGRGAHASLHMVPNSQQWEPCRTALQRPSTRRALAPTGQA